jgi:hypothetical protein
MRPETPDRAVHPQSAPLFLEVRGAVSEPLSGHLRMGAEGPAGAFGVNSRHLVKDGKPWLPAMGEFHFARCPAAFWEEELLKMKCGGITIVATYIFWIHHEEKEGLFDWSGRRSLRGFVECAARCGLWVWLRPGPWCHGEVRNGGFPDWLLEKKIPLRCDDGAYLKPLRRFYGEIADQAGGLLFSDGGPIIGLQVENEYGHVGGSGGAAHLKTLKELAIGCGLAVTYYSATGWGGSVLPPDEILPVYGGYPDAFWSGSLETLPPSRHYFFNHERDDNQIGDDLRPKGNAPVAADTLRTPFLTCEMGGGMQVAYHRRPLIDPDDVGVLPLVKLGSGANLPGYYMYHGGSNPDGITPLNESQRSGYPNDLPVKSYDFQAPLGEYGQVRPHFQRLRTLHLFLQTLGDRLAPMASFLPEAMPSSSQDRQTLRWALRSDGKRGFLFANQYQRDWPLADQGNARFRIRLAGEELLVPSKEISIPGGAYFMWPIHLDLDGVDLVCATAQPLCRIETTRGPAWFFFATQGIQAEYVLGGIGKERLFGDGLETRELQSGHRLVTPSVGVDKPYEISLPDGRRIRVFTLTREEADEASFLTLRGERHLALSRGLVLEDGKRIRLRGRSVSQMQVRIFPDPGPIPNLRRTGMDGLFACYRSELEEQPGEPAVLSLVSSASPSLPLAKGKHRPVLCPDDEEFHGAARWKVPLPVGKAPGVKEYLLRLEYLGDMARLYEGERLVADHFWDGRPWEIGVERLELSSEARELELRILPLRSDSPVFLAPSVRPDFNGKSELLQLVDARWISELGVDVDLPG